MLHKNKYCVVRTDEFDASLDQGHTCRCCTSIESQLYEDHFIREIRVNYYPTQSKRFAIRGPDDIACLVRSVLTENSREHFVAIYLDGAHQVASYSIISIGSANVTVVHPREVFQRAVLTGAISIVISHNHPSGVITPSKEDLAITKRLKDAGDILGIAVLDHVIVTATAHHSIREEQGW